MSFNIIVILFASIFCVAVTAAPQNQPSENPNVPDEVVASISDSEEDLARQGILEYPKQIATAIRKVIDDSLEKVWSSTWQTTIPDSTTAPIKIAAATSTSPKPTESNNKNTGSNAPNSTQNWLLGDHIIKNYIITTQAPSTANNVVLDGANANVASVSAHASEADTIKPFILEKDGTISPAEIDEYIYLLGIPTTFAPVPVTQAQVPVTSPPQAVVEVVTGEDVDPEDATVFGTEEEPEISTRDQEDATVPTTTPEDDDDDGDEGDLAA